jgi:hypothetical protein
MKKIAFASSTLALIAASFTPAMAAPVTLGSLPMAQQTSITNTCIAKQNGQFVGTPKDLDATVLEDFEISRVTITNIPGGQELSRTPFVFTTGSEHKNGQSPNIFGDFTSDVTFSGGLNVQEVVTADRTTVTFGCAMSKDNGLTFPNGQQIPNDGSLFVSFDANQETNTETVSAPDFTVTITEDRVICNSPTKNPGVWRAQNGYTGACSTTLYNAVNPGGTHSNSVPDLAPLRPNTDHNQPLPLDALDTTPIVLDDEV